jgi:hypothetical protein
MSDTTSGKRSIYVVRGTAGEYSDQRHWLVAAFGAEPDAIAAATTTMG